MAYSRPAMPLPVDFNYPSGGGGDTPPSYEEVTSKPPVLPPRPTGPPIPARPACPPPLAPRPGSIGSNASSAKIGSALPPRPSRPSSQRTNEISQQMSKLDVNGSIDFNNVLSKDEPLQVFERAEHEVHTPSGLQNDGKAIETNKFYGNMLVGHQTYAVWTHPYSLWLCKDNPYFGMAVNHTTADQRVFGPNDGPKTYMLNPLGIRSFVFSSTEFNSDQDTSLGFDNLKHMSADVQLKKNDNQYITFPLVQGMGFVTAIYNNLVPKIQSGVFFREFKSVSDNKYSITLENGRKWTLYVSGPGVKLTQKDSSNIEGDKSVTGTCLQLVADSNDAIDSAAGCYPTDCDLKGNVQGENGQYSFNYKTSGNSQSGKTLMYALPHHEASFTDDMSSRKTDSKLDATVCGVMTGYVTNSFEMQVKVPDKLSFDPFTTISDASSGPNYSSEVLDTIKKAAATEAHNDVVNESNLDSMYFSGKVLAKYAWILYCCQFIIKDQGLVSDLMPRLKQAVDRFIKNHQTLPLRYDTTWGGIRSSGNSSQDFGNANYNDHHFHYGYHVITAAILGIVDNEAGDKNWLSENKTWVENLIRDYANPSIEDKYFPVFRSFDWYNGHSWAKGIFESGDGKDEESTSEDVNAAYSLKLWGIATNNDNLTRIGDILLGILRTSINSYFLFTSDNKIMPKELLGNKVAGISFENKIDHTTYFGNKEQYIQMIQAIPIVPASSFVRTPKFVQEEWEEKLKPIVDSVEDGWKGLIMLNVALYDPKTSYNFFNSSDFQNKWLDDGQSLTWSLAYSGAFSS